MSFSKTRLTIIPVNQTAKGNMEMGDGKPVESGVNLELHRQEMVLQTLPFLLLSLLSL